MGMTKEDALRKQSQSIEHFQSGHRNLDVAALVAEHTYADALEDGIEYEYAQVRLHIPMGSDIESIIEKGYVGDEPQG